MLPLIFYSVILLQVSALLAATICTKRAEVHASAQRKYEGLCYPLQESDMLRTCRLNTTVIFVVYSSHKLRVKVIQSTVLPCRNNVRCPGLDQAEASLCAPVSPSLSRCYKSKPPLVFTLKWFISIKITFGSVREKRKIPSARCVAGARALAQGARGYGSWWPARGCAALKLERCLCV